jgi:hypothetical protein
MPGLGWRKAGEVISKGVTKRKFLPNIKGSLIIYKNDVLIL